MSGPNTTDDRNGNHAFTVIPIDPALRNVPCVFCLALGQFRSKQTHPQLDFWGNEEHTICTQHAEEALFAINNKDRPTLAHFMESMRQIPDERAQEER